MSAPGTMFDRPVLYIMCGLPGSGKSTLAQRIAQRMKCAYLRIDSIEQALRELCSIDVQGEGYRMAYRVAADNLGSGISVVADSCNPIELTRREWQDVALQARATYVNIEVVCSDAIEHRRRIETRVSSVLGLTLPTWQDVRNREYHDWTAQRIVIDTAKKSEADCADELLAKIARLG